MQRLTSTKHSINTVGKKLNLVLHVLAFDPNNSMIANSVVVANNCAPRDVCANHCTTIVQLFLSLSVNKSAKYLIDVLQRDTRVVRLYGLSYTYLTSKNKTKTANTRNSTRRLNLLHNFTTFSKFSIPTYVTARM